MYFYIDESGHTGTNLFDPDQPMLYYGVLSSAVNIDVLTADPVRELCRSLKVPRLHAAELGVTRLGLLASPLAELQRRFDLRFDIYRVAKADHAIISFFDQIFDHGVNPAITWSAYWTPLRYVMLIKVASLFNEDMARVAWEARICTDDERAQGGMRQVCEALRSRVHRLPDARSRELITDTLHWAERNPSAIAYNVRDREGVLQVAPNIVGFQSVMMGIANRLKKRGRAPAKIIVDRQTQFNRAQKTLADFYRSARGIKTSMGPGMPPADYTGMPNIPIEIGAGDASAGLQLTDLYLWSFKRVMERKELPAEFARWLNPQFRKARTDEISLNAISRRWEKYFEGIPELEDMPPEQVAKGKELVELDESRRQEALRAAGLR